MQGINFCDLIHVMKMLIEFRKGHWGSWNLPAHFSVEPHWRGSLRIPLWPDRRSGLFEDLTEYIQVTIIEIHPGRKGYRLGVLVHEGRRGEGASAVCGKSSTSLSTFDLALKVFCWSLAATIFDSVWLLNSRKQAKLMQLLIPLLMHTEHVSFHDQ